MAHIPSLTALRCFDASARHASFTKAAGEVHLTQGAVSHQIIALEQQLDVALFVRKRGGLQLTVAGRAYWTEVSAALRQIERATQDLVTHKGQGGALNLCVASSLATYWLMPRVGGFLASHPEVTLNLSTHIGPVDFNRSPHDAAIEYCEGPVPGLRASQVLPLVLRPYGAPALVKQHKAASGRREALGRLLLAAPLIRHTTVPQAWPGWLAAAGLGDAVPSQRQAGGPQYDLLSMALHGAIAGIGVALLPDYLVGPACESGQLVQLSPVAWTSDKGYYLRYPEWKEDLAALRSFQAWLGAGQ